MEAIISLLIQAIAGGAGGNAVGKGIKNLSLGSAGDTIAGAIGGVGGGQILGALIPAIAGAAEGGGVDIGSIIAQIIVGLLLTRDLPRDERLYLAFAQQNGITAMILALFFEKDLSSTVGIVAPAIIFINLGYYFFIPNIC